MNPLTGRRVLIVDDEPANRRLIRAILAGEGATLVLASDGAEALAAVEGGGIDLVLLDVLMPGLDGIEVCRRIRAREDYVPVVLITALTDAASRVRGKDAGADDFLSKPIHEDELLARTRTLARLRGEHLELVAQRRAAEHEAWRWRLMSEVAAAVASCRDYEGLLHQLNAALAPHVGIDCAGILDVGAQRLQIQAACGVTMAGGFPPIPLDEAGHAWIERLRGAVAVRVADDEPGPLAPVLRGLGFTDAIAIPAFGAGQLHGVFVAARATSFADSEVEDLIRIAPHVGNAVSTVRLLLRNQRLLRSRDELSQLLVHDLRNLLTAASANLEAAVEPGLTDQERDELLIDAHGATRRLTALVSDLLDVGAAEDGVMALDRRPTDIADLARQAVAEVVPNHATRSRVIDAAASSVKADPHLLARVFENLLANAVRHTPPGGRIDVVVGEADDRVTIAFSNDGPTIADELRPFLFQKWESAPDDRRTGKARGLGLYFCRLVVEAHGGTIRAAAPTRGARFEISLPI